MKYFLLLFITIHCFGQKSDTLKNDLLGCWIDSREENSYDSNTEIYRHCDFKRFPASRFRFYINLKDNNECYWLKLAPNDAHYTQKGTWKFNRESMTIEIRNTDKQIIKLFKIIEIEKEILKIEYLNPNNN